VELRRNANKLLRRCDFLIQYPTLIFVAPVLAAVGRDLNITMNLNSVEIEAGISGIVLTGLISLSTLDWIRRPIVAERSWCWLTFLVGVSGLFLLSSLLMFHHGSVPFWLPLLTGIVLGLVATKRPTDYELLVAAKVILAIFLAVSAVSLALNSYQNFVLTPGDCVHPSRGEILAILGISCRSESIFGSYIETYTVGLFLFALRGLWRQVSLRILSGALGASLIILTDSRIALAALAVTASVQLIGSSRLRKSRLRAELDSVGIILVVVLILAAPLIARLGSGYTTPADFSFGLFATVNEQANGRFEIWSHYVSHLPYALTHGGISTDKLALNHSITGAFTHGAWLNGPALYGLAGLVLIGLVYASLLSTIVARRKTIQQVSMSGFLAGVLVISLAENYWNWYAWTLPLSLTTLAVLGSIIQNPHSKLLLKAS